MAARFGDFLARAAQRAFKGFVAGNIQIDQRLGGHVEFELIAAAVDQSSCGNGKSSGLLDDGNRFAGRTARGPDVLDNQDTLIWLESEPPAESHAPGDVSFHEDGADAKPARHFVPNEDSAEGGRSNAIYLHAFEFLGERASELFS